MTTDKKKRFDEAFRTGRIVYQTCPKCEARMNLGIERHVKLCTGK